MTEIAYKIVTNCQPPPALADCGYLTRYVSLFVAGDCCLSYTPGQWTKPDAKHGKIFVFSSLKEARQWGDKLFDNKYYNGSHSLWRCKCKGLTAASGKYLSLTNGVPPADLGKDSICRFWSGTLSDKESLDLVSPPEGTMLADAILLLEEEDF